MLCIHHVAGVCSICMTKVEHLSAYLSLPPVDDPPPRFNALSTSSFLDLQSRTWEFDGVGDIYQADVNIFYQRLLSITADVFTWLPTCIQQYFTLLDFECMVLMCAYYRINVPRDDWLDQQLSILPRQLNLPLPVVWWFRSIGQLIIDDQYYNTWYITPRAISWTTLKAYLQAAYHQGAPHTIPGPRSLDEAFLFYNVNTCHPIPGFRTISLGPDEGTDSMLHGWEVYEDNIYCPLSCRQTCNPGCCYTTWCKYQCMPVSEYSPSRQHCQYDGSLSEVLVRMLSLAE